MIHAETVNGTIKVQCGKASGTDLICEAAALVTSVVRAVASSDGNMDVCDEETAKTAFKYIVTGAGSQIGEKTGINVFAPLDDKDEDTEEDDSDDGHVIVKALPADSDTAKKILELLGIDPDEAKSKDDDETKDDIPKYLF